MARVNLTVNQVVRAGLADPAGQEVTAANGAMFANDGAYKVYVRIVNGAVGASTITFVTPATLSGLAIADLTDSLGQNATKWYGPFETVIFNQASGDDVGKVYIETTQTVTITAFKIA